MFSINEFERTVRQQLKSVNPQDKLYLKERYEYEIFHRHGVSDDEIKMLFDMKKITRITPNFAFNERIDAEIDVSKMKRIKIVFQFDPWLKGKKQEGRVGIITAFQI